MLVMNTMFLKNRSNIFLIIVFILSVFIIIFSYRKYGELGIVLFASVTILISYILDKYFSRKSYLYNVPMTLINRDGPFEICMSNASIVTIELIDGKIFNNVILLHPNHIIGIEGYDKMPFDPIEIVKVFQSTLDKKKKLPENMTYWLAKEAKGDGVKILK